MKQPSVVTGPVVELSVEHVTCASPVAIRSLPDPFPLGPFDVFVPIIVPVAVVFVYRPSPTVTKSSFIPSERLRRALTLLLDSYPQLTGRLNEDPLGNRHITAFGSGVLYSTARCDLDLGDAPMNMADLPGESNDLFVPFVGDSKAVSNGPILSIRHTRFDCGSVTLGVRCLHTVCDAAGIFQLMEDLAEVYRGIETETFQLSRQPAITPHMSTPLDSSLAATALQYKPTLFQLTSNVGPSANGTLAPPPPTIGRFFRYSSTELRSLKAEASLGVLPGEHITTFDALSAHLHRCIFVARTRLVRDRPDLGPLSPPDLLSPVNMRLRPGAVELHDRYFPQALFTTYTTFDPETLLHGSLSALALAVHRMVREPTTTSPDQTQRTLEWLSSQSDKTKIQSGFRYGSGSLMLSAWNKVDMYHACALDVVPTLVSTPFTSISCIDGLGYFLPSADREDQGAIDVCLALSEPVWAYLDGDGKLGGAVLGRRGDGT